jgi:hypothetical protein
MSLAENTVYSEYRLAMVFPLALDEQKLLIKHPARIMNGSENIRQEISATCDLYNFIH